MKSCLTHIGFGTSKFLSIKKHLRYTLVSIFLTEIVYDHLTPCEPNPCGANAVCRELNGIGSCQCISDYFGDPYQNCRPECLINSDCPSNQACVQNKCKDPCPGTCGQNADCRIINHVPSCICRTGFSGDPYRYCNPVTKERKTIIYVNC